MQTFTNPQIYQQNIAQPMFQGYSTSSTGGHIDVLPNQQPQQVYATHPNQASNNAVATSMGYIQPMQVQVSLPQQVANIPSATAVTPTVQTNIQPAPIISSGASQNQPQQNVMQMPYSQNANIVASAISQSVSVIAQQQQQHQPIQQLQQQQQPIVQQQPVPQQQAPIQHQQNFQPTNEPVITEKTLIKQETIEVSRGVMSLEVLPNAQQQDGQLPPVVSTELGNA